MFEKAKKKLIPFGRIHPHLRWPIFGLLVLVWNLDRAWAFACVLGRKIWAVVKAVGQHLRETGLTPRGIHDNAKRLLAAGIRAAKKLPGLWNHVRQVVFPLVYTKGRAAWNAARQWCLAQISAGKATAPVCFARTKAFVMRAGCGVAGVARRAADKLRADLPQYKRHAPRRAMATALALVLCLGMLPVSAFAAETGCAHVHEASCHRQELNCGKAETEGHKHTDGCYTKTLDCKHVHDETCGGLAPAVPECSCNALPDAGGNTVHAEGCPLYVPEETPPAVCATCGEAHETADCPVETVRALLEALPTPEALAAMTEDERTQSGVYDQLGAARDAYDKLTVGQKSLLPTAEGLFQALITALGATPMPLAGEPLAPTVIGSQIYANGTPLLIVAEGTGTTVYIDTDRDGKQSPGELSLKGANINGAPNDGDNLTDWNIYGGIKQTALTGNTKITMTGGKVTRVYGGGDVAASAITGNTEVTITGGDVRYIYGGGAYSTVSGTATVTIEGAATANDVYGGGQQGTAAVGNTVVKINGGTMTGAIYGGGYSGTVSDTATVTITAGTTKNVYGGGERGTATVTNTSVTVTGGTVNGFIYGGGYDSAATVTSASVTVGGSAKVGTDKSGGISINGGSYTNGVDSFKIGERLTAKAKVYVDLPYKYTGSIIATEAEEGDVAQIALSGSGGTGKVPWLEGTDIKVVTAVLVTSVSLDKPTATLSVGDTETLAATVEPGNATSKVTWSSSAPGVATVNQGVVTAVSKGTATITATAGTKTATCAVTVNLKTMSGITVTPYGGSYDGLDHDMVKVTGAPDGSTITYSRTGGNNSYSTTIPTIKDVYTAASVWVKVSLAGYEDYVTQGEATITKVLLTPTIDMSGYTPREYNNTTTAAGAKITLAGKIVSGETPTATATVTFDTADAGTNKTVSATDIALESSNDVNKNYMILATELSSQSSMASITPKAVAVDWEVAQNRLVYSGDDHSKHVTASYLTQSGRKSLNVSFDRTPFKNAGIYTATATMKTPDVNHTLTNATREVTIARATRDTITMGAPQSVSVTSVTLASVAAYDEDGPATYGYSTTNDISKVANWQESLTFNGLTSGTTYYFFAKTAQGTNYLAAQSSALTVQTLAKSLTKIEVTHAPTKTAYQAFEAFVSDDMVVTASYDDGTTAVVAKENYTVSYPDSSRNSFLVSDTAVTITHSGQTATQAVTVTPAAGSGTVTLAGWIYGGAANAPVPVSTTNGTSSVTYQYKVKGADDGTYSATVPTNAGTYTVKATFAATENYTEATATAEFTIAPRIAEFTWTDPASLVYDGTEKQVSVSVSNKVGSDTVSGVLSGNTGTNAAEYTATVDSLSNDNGNYTLVGSTSATHTWSIAPLVAELLWDSPDTLTYDGTEKTVTATVRNAATSGSDSFTLAYTGNTATDAGSYTAKVTALSNTNYTLNGAIGIEQSWSIAPKTDAKLNISRDSSLTYNGTEQTQTISSVKVGETVIESGSYSILGNVQTNAGFYDLTVTVVDGNYKGSTGTASYDILQKPLTITAKPKTIVYGEAPTNDGVEYAGFENSESESVLTGTLDYAYSYAKFGNVGSDYTITPKGLTSNNYDITFANGTLTVEQKEVDLTWTDNVNLTYDGREKTPTVTATGTENNDALAVTVNRTSGDGTSVGTHTYTATGLTGEKAGNYKLPSLATHTVTITAAPPTGVTATGYTGTYDSAAHAAIEVDTTKMTGTTKVTFSNAENGTYSETLTVTNVTDSGTYWYKLTNQNYADFKGQATVKITPKALSNDMLTVTGTYTYTGVAQTPIFTATDAAASLAVNDYTAAASNNTAAGTATLTLTGQNNYTGTATQTFVIGKKPLADSMIAAIDAQTYTGSQLIPTPTVTDGTAITAADYTVSHGANINVNDGGTVTVTATDGGNYSGTATKNFTITQRPYDENSFTITIYNPAYTGVAVTPTVSVVYGGMTLGSPADYTVTFSDNTDVGADTAKAHFVFAGNYQGTTDKNFSIVNNPLPTEDFETALGVTAKSLLDWHKANIILTAQAGWTIGESATSLGTSVTLSKEGATSTDTVYAKDSAGKVYQTTVTYALDKTEPTIAGITGNPNAWTNQSTVISFTAADTLSKVASVTVKRGEVDYEVANGSFTADQNGDYTVTVTDKAGNTKTETVKVEKIDKTAPTADIALAAEVPASGWFTTDVVVNVTVADENLAKWQYSLDGTTWKDGTDASFKISANGEYPTVKVKAIDQAGNETVSANISVKLDKATLAAPTVTVTADGKTYTGDWTAADVVFTLTGTSTTSGHAKYQVAVGTADWADVTGSTYTVSTNTPGENGVNYSFRAVNTADTKGTASGTTLVKRRALEDTVLDSPDNKYVADSLKIGDAAITDGWYTTAPTVTVTRKDTLAGNSAETWYKLDSGAETKLTGTTLPALADGTHTLTIWTKDAAGNRTTPLVVTVKVDATAPVISGVTGNATAWQNTDVTLSVAATDATSNLAAEAYSFDSGATWQAESTKVYAANETLAVNTIQVKDAAGNIAEYATEIKIDKIDKTKPSVSVTAIDASKWYGKTELTVTSSDADSGVKTLTVQGGSFANATDIKAAKFTADEKNAGEYTYTVTVTDNAGNESTATVTIQLDPVVDAFAKLVTDTEKTDLDKLLAALDTYSEYSDDQKAHIAASDAGAAAKKTLDDAFTAKQNELLSEINGIIEKHPGTTTLADIDRAEELHKLLDDEHLTQVKDGYQQMLLDRDAAEDAINQINKENQTYEDKQTAQNTYDSLTENQKDLVGKEVGLSDKVTGLTTDMDAINAVIEKINAIQKPYKPEHKTAIADAKTAYDALKDAQKVMFPASEKARLDALVAMADKATATEAVIGALTESSDKVGVLAAQKAYDSLSAEEKALVSAESKAKLDAQYKAMLDKASADEKAAAAFTQQVTQTATAPTVAGIEALQKAHDALSDGAKAALDEATKTAYEKLIATLTDAVKQLIQDLEKLDITKLTPESKEDISELKDAYDKLDSDQKELVDTATGGKLQTLIDAVKEAAKAEEAIVKIPVHTGGSGVGTDCGEQSPTHTIAKHKSAIETAKLTYERLTDAGRALVAADKKTKLNTEYTALMQYMEYTNKADTASTKVEVAGLAEKVQAPIVSADVTKTVISVVMKDDKVDTAKLPETIAQKKQAVSVDIKLEAQSYKGLETSGNPVNVQPKQGETVLVKLKVPTGYETDTLEIWHVPSSGPARQIARFWLVTESDGTYAVFEVSSFSHFVLFAEQTPQTSDSTTVAKPTVNKPENGSVSLSPAQARPGQTVTVTPKPDEGYVVDKIVVTDQSGKEIPVKDNGKGTYSYTQPSSKVTVTVTFKPATTPQAFPFADVNDSDWFYESVKYVYEKGLMNGTAADKFGPNQNTSRGMLVTILWRLEGEPDATGANPFADVSADAYYDKAVVWAAENGIVKGYGSSHFGPNDPITREQLAVILYRYTQFKGMDTTAKGSMAQFTDQPSSWAAESVRWAVGAGLIAGRGNGVLAPTGQATRAETAKILTDFSALTQD